MSLNHDIYAIILDLLHIESPNSIYNICLTSKALYDLAQKYMFRRLRFTFSEGWNKHNRLLLERLEKDPTACSTVQEIYVNWAAGDNAQLMTKEQRWFNEQLCGLVTRSSALRTFIWDWQWPIPERLLLRIRGHAQCQLYETSLWFHTNAARTFERLHACSQLVALEVAIGNPHLEALGQLRQVLATCVNLKKLSVTGIRNRGSSSSLVLCRPGSQMPRLQFLKLRDINVCQPENLRCLRSMAWDTLGHLDSKVATLFTLAPFLKGVRSLVLSHGRSDEPINKSYFIRCLATLPKLEHVSLKGFTHMVMISVQDLVDRCGTPLRSFRTHGEAATGPNWPYPRLALTKEDVQHIGNRCMRLETFGMDLHVESTWPWEMLFVIVESLWSVVHLEFDVELIKGTALPLLVNLTSVRLLWTFLWGNLKRVRRERGHVITRPRLQTLKVTANIPSSFQAVRFEARLSERDDLALKGGAEVVYLELEGLLEKNHGHGSVEDQAQEAIRWHLIHRAEHGYPTKDRNLLNPLRYPQIRPLKTTLCEMLEW